MFAAFLLLLLLTPLEYLFWLSPLKVRFNQLMDRVGDWYYLLPFHYLIRLAILAGVIAAFRPATWPVFAGGAAWGWSLLGGLALAAVNLVVLVMRPMNLSAGQFFRRADAWRRGSGWRFWAQTGYLLAYPGFAEELLFRWFFPAAFWPALSWWTLLAGPLAMMIWHIPVWYAHFAHQPRPWAMLTPLLIQTTLYSVLLTVVAVSTQNIAGCVLAHAFGDWIGSVMRWSAKRAA